MEENTLPKRRIGRLTAWLDRSSLSRIILVGVGLYAIVPLFFSFIEIEMQAAGSAVLKDIPHAGFDELLYFNFITIMTVGYGDLIPIGFGRGLSVIEAVAGVFMFGLMVAIGTIKATLPPRSSISFSRYGYYCTEEERFMVIFVNATTSVLVNPEMCSYFRQGNNWVVRPAYRAPFIRQSVWTFHVDELKQRHLIAGGDDDISLRFGITGQLGLSSVSAYAEYESDKILVIPNRSELVAYKGFRDADLSSEEMRAMFHYAPKGAPTLREFLRAQKTQPAP